jgi:hypothetical protein
MFLSCRWGVGQSAAAGVDFGTDAAAAFLITGGFVYFGAYVPLLAHSLHLRACFCLLVLG